MNEPISDNQKKPGLSLVNLDRFQYGLGEEYTGINITRFDVKYKPEFILIPRAPLWLRVMRFFLRWQLRLLNRIIKRHDARRTNRVIKTNE